MKIEFNWMRRGALGVVTLGLVVAGAAGLTAFEAHVVNVTAEIENVLNVPIRTIDFGTVFPQEKFGKIFDVSLSSSFMSETRVDDVEYFLRQKPKCANDPLNPTEFSQVAEDAQGNFICSNPQHQMLPLLCPYLSKSEITQDGTEGENDGSPLPPFHGPIALSAWTPAVAQQYTIPGRLVKSGQDTSDTWNIDLKVPCFGNHCAQDWDSFVLGINASATPANYIQPIQDEHKVYGCDVWLEVTGISLPPDNGTLIVQKVLINDDLGTATTTDFSFSVNGGASVPFEADGENQLSMPPGTYEVVENVVSGYDTTYQNCDNLNIATGQTEICVITNDDVDKPANLAVYKQVINDNGGNNLAGDFQMTVDGNNLAQGATTTFSTGLHVVSETGVSGYVANFSGDCDSSGNVTLAEGQTKVCIVTNNDLPANITLIKSVVNNNSGSSTPTSFTLRIDGSVVPNNTSVAVAANSSHFINEDPKAGYTFVSITGTNCPSATSTPFVLNEGEAITCTITNDDNPPQNLFSDPFGTASTSTPNIVGWDETGDDNATTTQAQAAAGSGEDAASPDGGRFAKIGNGEWICREVDASGFNTLAIKYYWKGDVDAEDNESGFVEYRPSGSCSSISGWSSVASHELDDGDNNADEGWSSLETANLPASLNNDSSFWIRFRNGASAIGEDFRIDGVSLTGVPN